MKRILTGTAIAAALGAGIIATTPLLADAGPGYGPGPGYGYHMGYGMGPAMMGYGMGPGMMMGYGAGAAGGWHCPGLAGDDGDAEFSVDTVRKTLEQQLAWQGNERLKVGTIEQKDDDTIVAEIVTKDDSLVERLAFDRRTGFSRRVD